MNQDELINAWYQAQQSKVHATTNEKNLRLRCADEVFGYEPDELPTGSEKHPLPGGWSAKMTFKVSERIDQKEVGNAIAELRQMGMPEELINSLFKWEAKINKSIYKSLSPAYREVIDIITTKRSSIPILEIVSPKNGK